MTDKRTLARWRNAVIAAFAIGGITSATVGPRMPSLRADLGVGDAVIGAMLAGVTLGAFVGLGARPRSCRGSAPAGASAAPCGWSRSAWR